MIEEPLAPLAADSLTERPTPPPVDWVSLLGAEEMARILAKPISKRAAAFEKAVRARAPHQVGPLRARYPTLSGSTVKRVLRREVRDLVSRDDEDQGPRQKAGYFAREARKRAAK